MTTPFSTLLADRLSRRDFLARAPGVAAAAGLATAVPSAIASALESSTPASISALAAVAPSKADALVVAAGVRYDTVIAAGDALWPGDPGLTAADLRSLAWLDESAAARQDRRFGVNNDALAFFAEAGNPRRGTLCVNHEYVQPQLVFAGLTAAGAERGKARDAWITAHPQTVPWMQSAHGVSVLTLQRGLRGWQVQRGTRATRRVTANTPMQIAGPARGHGLMRTVADPSGTVALGTFANCAGGKTPWGTYLTAEENIQDYFGGATSWASSTRDETTREAHRRWPIGERSVYGWDLVDARFDLRREPHEPFRHGWIVEIDPTDPTSPPKKRTALGRFCHEGANTILTGDGRVAAYMGDDTKFEYVYKFVTRDRCDPKNRAANRDLLDQGVLYVARFDASGNGEWLPLVHDERGPLNSRNGYSSQADVVIKCRAAADVLGATPMDRPEDVEPNPVTGRVYMALTKNADRAQKRGDFSGREINFGADAPNPRLSNDFGHIIELIEADDDAASTRFRWNVFLLAGDPSVAGSKFLTRAEDVVPGRTQRGDTYYAGFADRSQVSPIACPDNLGFDPSGKLWIVTDADGDLIANNGCFVVPTQGPERGLLRQIASAPVGAEVCGCEFTPDGTTLFLSIQHPGEGGTVDRPVSHWPDGNGLPPRSAVVALSREDGKPL